MWGQAPGRLFICKNIKQFQLFVGPIIQQVFLLRRGIRFAFSINMNFRDKYSLPQRCFQQNLLSLICILGLIVSNEAYGVLVEESFGLEALNCRTPCELVLESEGRKIQEVLVDVYEDRWFFEEPGVRETKCLMFKEDKFFWRDCGELKGAVAQGTSDKVANYLASQSAVLEQFPVKKRSVISTSDDGHHKAERWLGNFAQDLQVVDEGESVSHGTGEKLKDHYSYGARVYAPLQGTIEKVVRDQKDKLIDLTFSKEFPEDEQLSNYILIHVKGPIYFVLVHFKKNTIPKTIKKGIKISQGDYLGEIGNSGVSYVPHLHMTTYYKDPETGRMISIPTLLKNGKQVYQPLTGEIIEASFNCQAQF